MKQDFGPCESWEAKEATSRFPEFLGSTAYVDKFTVVFAVMRMLAAKQRRDT